MTNHVKVSACIQNIHVALAKHDEYKSNYQMLFALPLVSKLRNRNRQLKKQVRTLKNMLMKTQSHTGNKEVIIDLTTEAEDAEAEGGGDDDVVIVKVEKESEKERIVYEIEEEEGADEPEAFTEEIQAQEEGEADEEVEEVEEEEVEEVVVEEEEVTEEEEEVDEEEEVEEVVVEEEEVAVEEEEVEYEEVEEVEVEEEEEVEFEEVVIKGVTYCTNDAQNGEIYAVTEDGELGDMVGNFVKGKAVFLSAVKKA